MRPSPLDAYRPTWAEIDLDALAANLAVIRRRVGALPIMAVVKADAYGHGAVPVARALEAAGVAHFGVALPEEGVELRRGGLRGQVLVLGGFAPPQAELILAHDLTPAVFRPDQVESIARAAAAKGVRARVHLKVDTGMGRLGVPAADVPDFASLLEGARAVTVSGVFSHLAVADEPSDPFTRTQLDRFRQAVETLAQRGIRPEQVHLANSAAIMDHEPAWLTLVRPGIILYGYAPSAAMTPLPIRPVLSLRTRIIYLKQIPPGTSLGYGRTYVAASAARVASLALGYDDGLPRPAGNRGYVLIRGRRAPIVGRISMDLTTVDVTAIPEASLGDEALVIGISGPESLGADRIASWIGGITWEILCGIGSRVPRLYRGAGREQIVSRFASPLV
ncbi:MAG TPA: alanine racemase [Candidatus Polarisedimenticolia bacterium]|nr:alanine racemase [Candidatus Polarisedimenticolia bacterium]